MTAGLPPRRAHETAAGAERMTEPPYHLVSKGQDMTDATVWEDLVRAICKEPPCMYGSNERVYILSLIEAARARETSRTSQEPSS